jgi:Spy/CpxP family protein refolding chaperone
MKRLLGVVAVVALASGISFGLTYWLRPRPVRLHETPWLRRELNLTDAQASHIEKAEAAFHAKVNAACAEHCAARMKLGEEIAKPKPDPEECRAAVQRMNALQAESERATLEHILKVRSLLNEQQAQRFSALIRDQICSMPMGTP